MHHPVLLLLQQAKSPLKTIACTCGPLIKCQPRGPFDMLLNITS